MNEQPIRVLDLFSGIGGFSLAAEKANAMADAGLLGQEKHEKQTTGIEQRSLGSRFVGIAHAEVEPFACSVYHKRFPDSVCFGGVENVSRDSLIERCGVLPDVVCGGFPCQPHSCAGKRLASADERDLWGECRRILGDVRPRFALFENVGGLLTSESGLFFNRVLSDLAALRYACQWQVIPAIAVGAPHRRDRIWMLCWDELADADQAGRRELRRPEPVRQEQRPAECGCLAWPALSGQWPSRPGEPQHGWEPSRVVAHTDGRHEARRESGCGEAQSGRAYDQPCGPGTQSGQAESSLGFLPDGLPSVMGGTWPEVHNRVAQLKAAGNAIVPQVAAIFMYAILRIINKESL